MKNYEVRNQQKCTTDALRMNIDNIRLLGKEENCQYHFICIYHYGARKFTLTKVCLYDRFIYFL